MLADYAPTPTLAVADLTRARKFYEEVLHLTPDRTGEDAVIYGAGGGTIMVYPSAFAGTNKATAMSFEVPSTAFDAEVSALREAGVEFLTFEAPGATWQDGVATFEEAGMKGVWFEDPDGNILNVDTMV